MGVIDFYREKKDTTPVQGSKNGITSGAVYDALQLIKQFDYTTVAQLPTASADTMYRVYFVPSSNPGQQDTYDEYITTENDSVYSWERIGNSSIDISNIVKPIELIGLPSDSTDTVEKLNALGLTQTEILAASQGKRTGVVYNNIFYTIQAVNYISDTSYTMIFSNYGMYKLPPSLEDDTLYYWECNFYRITRNGNYVGCNATNIPANTPV